jgi:hypothetical protein
LPDKEKVMFYCKECEEKQGWPEGWLKSYGPCEICGVTGECSDTPYDAIVAIEARKMRNIIGF